MNVAIRADASEIIGAGHVMRCLTLAGALKVKKFQVSFICQELPGHLCDFIEASGFRVYRMTSESENISLVNPKNWKQDADKTIEILGSIEGQIEWMVVDHYGLDKKWESKVASCVNKIMVIDDLADRSHQCNILLDQNYCSDKEGARQKYTGLVPAFCEMLLGPKYALLRKEFTDLVGYIPDENTKRVLVSLGGSDVHNVTLSVIHALEELNEVALRVDVVVGQTNPQRKEIEKKCASLVNFYFHCQVSNMAALVAKANVVIGAGGTSTWERCCLGVPSVVITVADNQVNLTKALANDGYILYLGDHAELSVESLRAAMMSVLNNDALCCYLGRHSQSLVDGKGVVRVINALLSQPVSLRTATSKDSEKVFMWRNDPAVRRFSINPTVIDRDTHEVWFQKKLEDPRSIFLIGESEGEAVGVLRFETKGELATVSIYLAPGKQDQGFGCKILAAGSQWLKLSQTGVKLIEAHILRQNKASRASFKKVGYKEEWSVFQYRFE